MLRASLSIGEGWGAADLFCAGLFAVGALHFPRKDGILALLRKKGYRITRIQPPGTATPT